MDVRWNPETTASTTAPLTIHKLLQLSILLVWTMAGCQGGCCSPSAPVEAPPVAVPTSLAEAQQVQVAVSADSCDCCEDGSIAPDAENEKQPEQENRTVAMCEDCVEKEKLGTKPCCDGTC